LNWTASPSADWVKLSSTSGKTPGAVTVGVGRLPEGNHTATLRLTAKDASGAAIDSTNVTISVKIIKKVNLVFLPLTVQK
jgi:hypothetical protein